MKAARLWIGIIAVAGIVMAGAGCSEDESESGLAALTSPAASIDAAAWIPDMSEIESAMDMTADQSAAVEAALTRFQESVHSMVEGAGSRGRSGWHGHGRGACSGDTDAGRKESPFLTMVEEVADALDPGQFLQFAQVVGKRHQEHREQMGDRGRGRDRMRGGRFGHGKPHGDGHGERLDQMMDALDLTDEQRAQVEEAAEAMHEQMQELHEQCRESDEDRAECRERGRELHDQFRAQLETILTAEQLEQLDDLRNERREERSEQRDARMEVRADRMVTLLSKILDLTADQEEQIRAIHESMAEERQAIRDQMHSGEVSFEDMREQRDERRDEIHQAIRDILTPDQQEVFDALADLLPHHGPGFGHGPGHGVGGPF
jgi:Spy/CpxP family protein refolding chaperone